jgi:tetratricopeptide (TPR) repeat protein
MIKASPLFGSGLGTFQIVFPSFRYPGFAAEVPIGNLLHAHSEYLEIWAEMGLLGLGVFLWLMASFFGYVLKRLRPEREEGLLAVGLLCGVAGVLVDGLFSASMRWTGPAFAFWLTFSLAVAVSRPQEMATGTEREKDRGRLIQIVVICAGIITAALVARWHLQNYKANVHLGRTQALLDGGLPSQAFLELGKAQKLNPRCLPAIYLAGCLKIKEGDFQGARGWFEKLERLAPDYANSHEWKGYLHFRLGDLSSAEEEFKSCIRQKGSVFRHNMLGRIYSLQGKWDQALEQLGGSIQLGAAVSKSQPEGSAVFSLEQGIEQPIEVATDAETDPASDFEQAELVKAHMMLARIYFQKEEYEKSIEQVRSIDQQGLNGEQRRTIAGLLNNIAWNYAKTGENLDGALDLCEEALRLSHPHPELVHDTKAWVYLKKGYLKEARLEIERALETAPGDTLLRQHLELIKQAEN